VKAAVYHKYGPPEVVSIKTVARPSPKDKEVLIKNFASTVTSADWRTRSLILPPGFASFIGRLAFGIFGPRKKILGLTLAGEISELGKGVTKFNLGDRVFAIDGKALGGHAQFKVMPEDGAIALIPENLSSEEAAALPFGGTTAYDFLKVRGGIQSSEKVLINGASGDTGTAAVQLAKHFGADVTGVCSTSNLELVKSIGANKVIDYTTTDFSKNGETYDMIIDTVATASWARSNASLTKKGRLLLILGSLSDILRAPFVSKKGGKKLIAGEARERAEDLRFLAKLAESGEFKPVVDRIYPLDQIVAAHTYVDTGHKKGSVVIRIDH